MTEEIKTVTPQFDVNREDFYRHDKPELKERTRARLIEIASCGLGLVGYGQFGYPGVMSGLYIEMVWTYSEKDFQEYMEWTRSLILNKPQ